MTALVGPLLSGDVYQVLFGSKGRLRSEDLKIQRKWKGDGIARISLSLFPFLFSFFSFVFSQNLRLEQRDLLTPDPSIVVMSSQPPPSAWNGSQVNGSSSPGSNYSSHPNQPPQPQSRPTSSGQGSFNNGNSNNNNYSQQFPRQSQQLPPNNRHSSFNALDSQSSMNSRPNPSSPPPTTATTSNPQPDSHRRTQSMRPMSAFQPMDSVGPMSSSPSLGNGPNSSSFQRPSSPSGSLANSISRSTNQPLTFKSADLRAALALHEAQNSKIYMEGYLSRRDECASDGKPLHPNDDKRRWNLCFVQLSGTVMSVWSVKEMDKAAKEGREVPPSYINITDSVSSKRDRITAG